MKSIMDQRVKSGYILWIFLPRTQPVFIFCSDLNKNFVNLAQKQSVLASCEGDTTVEYERKKVIKPCVQSTILLPKHQRKKLSQ